MADRVASATLQDALASAEDAEALRDAYIPSVEKVKAAFQVCKRQLTVKLLLSIVDASTQAAKQMACGSTKFDPFANQTWQWEISYG